MTRPDHVPAWISWISGVIISAVGAGIGVMTYAYATFQTVRAAEHDQSAITDRLDRMEDKIDRLLEHR